MLGEIKQVGQILENTRGVTRVGQLRAGIPQLIEEGVDHGVDRTQTLCRGVLEQLGNEVKRVLVSLAEDLAERVRLDLRELVLHVVRVHSSNLLARRCSQDLDDFHELVDTRLSREQWLTKHELCHDTAR